MSKLKIGLLVIILLFSYCSQRDLSTPSSRLVGHWMRICEITQEDVQKEIELYRLLGDTLSEPLLQVGVYETHYFFDKLSSDGIGSLISVDDERVFHNKYQILAELPNAEELKIRIITGDSSSRIETYFIDVDGIIFIRKIPPLFDGDIETIDTLSYVDNKTEP